MSIIQKNYNNGLDIDTNQVGIGGTLSKNTTITEDGFDFTSDRTDNPSGYGTVSNYYKCEIGTSSVSNYNNLVSLGRKIGTVDTYGDAEIGVFGDNNYESVAYFKANSGPSYTEAYVSGDEFRVNKYSAGSGRGGIIVGNNSTSLSYPNSSVTLNALGISIFSFTNSIVTSGQYYQKVHRFASGSTPWVDTLEVPIKETISPGFTYSYTKAVEISTFIRVKFEGTYIENSVTGFGVVETKGAVGRFGVGLTAISTTSSETITVTPGIGTFSTQVIISGYDLKLQLTNNSTNDITVVGVLTTTSTQIT